MVEERDLWQLDKGRAGWEASCKGRRAALRGAARGAAGSASILAEPRLALTEPFGISALYFSVLLFLEDFISLSRMHSAGSDPAERRLTKPCMLRKLVQNSDSARPSRAKKIPLDLADYAEPFLCPCQSVVQCACELPWFCRMLALGNTMWSGCPQILQATEVALPLS